MKIITLHCDYIKFKPVKEAIKSPEKLNTEQKKGFEVKECLVVLSAVEKNDEGKEKELIQELVKNVKEILNQVKAEKVVLYPYVHLTSNPSKPDSALIVLEEAKKLLEKEKVKVVRAPFGWYKEFELKCKGHPLSELSREISFEAGKSAKEKYNYEQLLREISKIKIDREKLKDNDHRIIGQQLELFSFSEVAPGMVFWHNKGLIIKNELINFWREEHKKAGYEEISTPIILDKKLWQISGHWEKYKENIFLTEYDKRTFAVKPMNCPGGILVYKSKQKSYKELPLRIAEIGVVHRQELSGVLGGLFRVIQFAQDDAHIYCSEEQLEQEISSIIELIDKFYTIFNFKYDIELSTRPERRIGSDEIWSKAEKVLENVLKKKKIKFKINEGQGAFYGPKIDFHIKDSLGRTWQCGTIQIDFSMPERFDLAYEGKDDKKYRPVMIHRAIYGSFERFIGILLEHFSGKLPLWLNPVQIEILTVTDRNTGFADEILKKLKDENLRAEIDDRNETINKKVRESQLQKVNYIITIGDKESKSKKIAIRTRDGKVEFDVSPENFIKRLKEEIKNKIIN